MGNISDISRMGSQTTTFELLANARLPRHHGYRLQTSYAVWRRGNSNAPYTVLWHAEATNELAEVWVESLNRKMLTDATYAIDLELANAPSSKGSELSEGLRVLVEPPLQVLFFVREDDRAVEVLRIKLI